MLDRKGYFYCFGCHEKGSALDFRDEARPASALSEAVEVLAAEAGMQPPVRDKRRGQAARRSRATLSEATEAAVAYFRDQLATPPRAAKRGTIWPAAV